MKKVILKNDFMGKQPIIRIEFPFDFELKELVKTFPDCSWDTKKKVWWVSYSDNRLSEMLEYFKGKVWLDYSELKKVTLTEEVEALPSLSDELSKEIENFVKWMRNKRYSENTIKTYKESINLFFRFLENKPIDHIENLDLERFNTEYILFNKYSSSYQNQFVNAIKLFYVNKKGLMLNPNIIYRPKKEKVLPNVLSKEDIRRFS